MFHEGVVHDLTKKRLLRLETISTRAGGVAGGVAGGLLPSVLPAEVHCRCPSLATLARPLEQLPVEDVVEQEPEDSEELCDIGE